MTFFYWAYIISATLVGIGFLLTGYYFIKKVAFSPMIPEDQPDASDDSDERYSTHPTVTFTEKRYQSTRVQMTKPEATHKIADRLRKKLSETEKLEKG